jgi:hypothetical protein
MLVSHFEAASFTEFVAPCGDVLARQRFLRPRGRCRDPGAWHGRDGAESEARMSKLLRGLVAGYGAKMVGGGCWGTPESASSSRAGDGALLTNGNACIVKNYFIHLYMRSIIMLRNLLLVAMSAALVNTAYAFDATQQAEMVTAHNKWRQAVGTPPLAWSAALAATAQAWADQLKATQGCKAVHSGTAGVGENIFWASATTQTSTS